MEPPTCYMPICHITGTFAVLPFAGLLEKYVADTELGKWLVHMMDYVALELLLPHRSVHYTLYCLQLVPMADSH